MIEENNQETTQLETTAKESLRGQKKSGRRSIYLALAIVSVLIVGIVLIALFRSREGGQPVPAPRSVTFDENSAEVPPLAAEQTITIEPEQVERIGIKIETVGEMMSTEAATVAAAGVVQPNNYRETPVISRVGGIVHRINAELGENVSRGQTVAVIFSDEFAAAQSRYLTLQTEAQTARQNFDRASKLLKINPVSRTELDEATAKLKTSQAELDEVRRRYNRTVKLVEIGASSREEFEQDRTKLKTAEAELERANKQYSRTVELVRINPSGSGEIEQAAVKLRTAETELASAKQRLILLGLSEKQISALRSASQISSQIAVTAPVSGTVTTRAVNQGQTIEANLELLKVTDLSKVWVIAQVYEKDLAKMRTGSGASVTTDAYPGNLFRGQVTYIDPNINQETRTAQVRIELENPGRIFKLGMYVKVSFGALGNGEMTSPVIPVAAVQNMSNRQIVFTATDKTNVFIMKAVRLGTQTNGQFPVLEGLNVGDKIVTDGSFLLRAEFIKQNPK